MGKASALKQLAHVARGKVRRLPFDGDTEDGRTEFRLLYIGFQQGASHQESRPIDIQTLEADILHKLWAISTDNEAVPQGVVPRNRLLKEGSLAIDFTDGEWTILLRYYNSARITWVIDSIGDVVELRTRLDAITLTDPDAS